MQQFSVKDKDPGSLASQRLGQFLEPLFQLQRELLVTLLTNGLHVKLNKLVPAGKKKMPLTLSRAVRHRGRLSHSHTNFTLCRFGPQEALSFFLPYCRIKFLYRLSICSMSQ